jgi:catechol 2,3-dioxygenase-like lactoylglutathione lyase family enzyme
MVSGAHVIVYRKNAEADRAFFRDVFGFKSVDAGHGWLIFALPSRARASSALKLRNNDGVPLRKCVFRGAVTSAFINRSILSP